MTQPTLVELQALSEHLPEFNDSASSGAAWLTSPQVQSYLNHYNINFVREHLCQSYRFGQFTSQGFRLALHHWQPPASRGIVFFVHGFTDHTGLMGPVIRHLLQHRWSVVCFDLPGHGLSSGAPLSIRSFDQYRDALSDCMSLFARSADALSQPWHGVGQSTGAAIWLHYLSTTQATAIGHICLLSPLVRPRSWSWLQYMLPLVRLTHQQLPRSKSFSSHDEAFLEMLHHRDPLQVTYTPVAWINAMHQWSQRFIRLPSCSKPLLVLQGDDDKTVDFRYNLPKIARQFPNSQCHWIHGAGHQLVNELPHLRDPAFALMEEWMSTGRIASG